LGTTTLALAQGLAANTRAQRYRMIDAFDLFQWAGWMDFQARNCGLPGQHQPGQSFYQEVKELLSPYRDIVNVERKDLLEYAPPAMPIEFLFIDAMKSWGLADKIASGFFPLLLKNKSYVVQQDFAWYNSVIATNHLMMWLLRDRFQCVHHVPGSCSVVFRCIKRCEASRLPRFTPDLFTAEMVEEAYEYSLACVSPDMRYMMEVAKLGFLIEQGYAQAAQKQLQRVAESSSRLLEPMLAEVKRAVAARTAAESANAGRPTGEWLREIDSWASEAMAALP
jgi:hypothetical protein